MTRFLAISLAVALFCNVTLASDEKLYPSTGGGGARAIHTKVLSGDEHTAAIEDIQKRFPSKNWKTVGFCGYSKEPVVLFRVPSFLKWDSSCNLHHFKKDIEFCGPSESSPRLSGAVEVSGVKRKLQVGLEAFSTKKPYKAKYDLKMFDSPWKEYGSLLSVEKIGLGGHPAFQAVIEDHKGTLPKTIKSQTLIEFSHSYVGGMLYFIETEERPEGQIFIWHDEWIFQNVVSKIIESFEFKVKVE